MPQLNAGLDPTIYLGDTRQNLENLRGTAVKHRDLRDTLNSFFGNDPMKRPEAISWEKRSKEGLIENGVVKVTAGDALIGRSQPELQLAYETWRQKELQRQAIPLNAALRAEGRSPVKIDTDTNSSTLDTDALQLGKIVQNRDILLGMNGGPAAYAALGDNPTSSQILGAISARQTAIDAPGLKREKDLFDDNIETNKSARATNTAATTLAQSRFDLEETNSAENQNFREWQAQDQSAYRKFQEAEQTRRLQYDNDNRVSDRTLQIQLAEMNRDERGEVRREDRRRDAKKDRQLMLLQLINGLKQTGQSFGG